MKAQPSSGLGPAQERLYRHLLRTPPSPLEDHAAAIGWPEERAQEVLRDLERLQLARRAPEGEVRVDDPRSTIGRFLDEEEARLDAQRRELLRLRGSLESFELDYRRGLELVGPRLPFWEQVEASQATSVVDHLFRSSTGTVLQVVRQVEIGPGHHSTVRRQRDQELAAGRTLRTILPVTMLADPHWQEFAQERAERGEQQRFLPVEDLAVEFGVFGPAAVLVYEDVGPDGDYLLLRGELMASVFTALFDALWLRGQAFPGPSAHGQDLKLLEYLAMGFKDEAMARQLGVSLRTVRRRVAALMAEYGVETRYQLGMAVSSRGASRGGR